MVRMLTETLRRGAPAGPAPRRPRTALSLLLCALSSACGTTYVAQAASGQWHVMHERVPSTGDPFPYVHFFFRMQDGSTIAFFEAVGLPQRPEPTHPAYRVFDHLALEVGTQAEVYEWRDRLVAHEVEIIGPINHGIIYSVYFHDPNGIRLEITTPLAADWNDRPEVARDIVGSWLQAKRQAEVSGRAAAEVLRQAIAARDSH